MSPVLESVCLCVCVRVCLAGTLGRLCRGFMTNVGLRRGAGVLALADGDAVWSVG